MHFSFSELEKLLNNQKHLLFFRCSTSTSRPSYKNAKLEFERRKKLAEKAQKADERKQHYLDKQAAIKAYREKKAERFKILSKKTSKGQPLMAGRMELLLEKIRAQES